MWLVTCSQVGRCSLCEHLSTRGCKHLTALLACVHTSCCYKMNARHADQQVQGFHGHLCLLLHANFRCHTHNNTGDQLHAPRSTAAMPKIGGPKRTPAAGGGTPASRWAACWCPAEDQEMEASAQSKWRADSLPAPAQPTEKSFGPTSCAHLLCRQKKPVHRRRPGKRQHAAKPYPPTSVSVLSSCELSHHPNPQQTHQSRSLCSG